MAPDQESNNINGSAIINRADNISIQIELPGSTSNVSPSPDYQIPEENHATLVRCSVLRESLHPITLKVHIQFGHNIYIVYIYVT